MQPYALRVDVDLDVIRQEYPLRRARDLASDIGIHRDTLRNIAAGIGLGLKRTHRPWTSEDRRTLKRYWGHQSAADIADRLGRSRSAVMVEMHRMRRRDQCGR